MKENPMGTTRIAYLGVPRQIGAAEDRTKLVRTGVVSKSLIAPSAAAASALSPTGKFLMPTYIFPRVVWGKYHEFPAVYDSTRRTTINLPANFALTGIKKYPMTSESTGLTQSTPHRIRIQVNDKDLISDAGVDLDVFVNAGYIQNTELPSPYLIYRGGRIVVYWDEALWSELAKTPVLSFCGYFIDLETEADWGKVNDFMRPQYYISEFNFSSNNQTIQHQVKVNSLADFEIKKIFALTKTYTQQLDGTYTAAIVAQSAWDATANMRLNSNYQVVENDTAQMALWLGDRQFPSIIEKPLYGFKGNAIDIRITNTAASTAIPVVTTVVLMGRNITLE